VGVPWFMFGKERRYLLGETGRVVCDFGLADLTLPGHMTEYGHSGGIMQLRRGHRRGIVEDWAFCRHPDREARERNTHIAEEVKKVAFYEAQQ
jgi:hypothetical protein